MSGRLDKLLRTGERVIYRPTVGARAILKVSLPFALFLGSTVYGIGWIGASLEGATAPVPAIFGIVSGGMALVLPFIFAVRGRSMAVLTDRRLLLFASPIAREPAAVALSDVHRVNGLARGSFLPVQVETIDGRIVSFNEELWERNLGIAIADAVGLPSADFRTSRIERIAGLLYRLDRWGMLASVAVFAMVGVWLLGTIISAVGDLSMLSALSIVFPSVMLLILAGTVAGRIVGPILAVLWVRRSAPAEDLHDAFHLLAHRQLLPRRKDECRRLQPVIWRTAGLIYGQRFDPTTPAVRSGDT